MIKLSIFVQRIAIFLWSRIYKKWLWDDFFNDYERVLKVRGWRTALVVRKSGSRHTMTPCFWWFD